MIRVSAVVLRDATGAVLTVRKRGTDRFMFPGGKPEPGETPVATAIRECGEEVQFYPDRGDLRELGVFRSAAANEPGHEVEATVFEFVGTFTGDIVPAAEIAESRWQRLDETPLPADLAPLLAEAVLPVLGNPLTRS